MQCLLLYGHKIQLDTCWVENSDIFFLKGVFLEHIKLTVCSYVQYFLVDNKTVQIVNWIVPDEMYIGMGQVPKIWVQFFPQTFSKYLIIFENSKVELWKYHQIWENCGEKWRKALINLRSTHFSG